MKKLLIVMLVSAVSLFGISGTSSAGWDHCPDPGGCGPVTSYTDQISMNVDFNSSHTTQTWTLNLDTDTLSLGNINAEDVIKSGTLYITFNDDWDPLKSEHVSVLYDGFSWKTNYEVDDETINTSINLSYLNDHQLAVQITRVDGDFSVTKIKLSGEYYDCPVTTPEPATLLLFGGGLFGVAMFRKIKGRI